MSTSEPQTTMVTHAFDNGGVQRNLLIASISPFAWVGEDLDDFDLPDPKGLGLWLWRDTGSEWIMPTEFDEDGGVCWSGDWVRPDHEQALALASGVLPWSKETVVSAIAAERDLLLDRVRQLDDHLLDAHCDLAAAKDRIAELAPAPR